MGFVEDETLWCGGHVSARVRCVRANNPSPMTYVGTNSWIVVEPGAKECVVIDPAPAGEQVQRILATCGEAGLRIGAIVATHDHPDHIENSRTCCGNGRSGVRAAHEPYHPAAAEARLREVRRREACVLGGRRGHRCGRSWVCRRIGFGGLASFLRGKSWLGR